jgi:hypothetical protein
MVEALRYKVFPLGETIMDGAQSDRRPEPV